MECGRQQYLILLHIYLDKMIVLGQYFTQYCVLVPRLYLISFLCSYLVSSSSSFLVSSQSTYLVQYQYVYVLTGSGQASQVKWFVGLLLNSINYGAINSGNKTRNAFLYIIQSNHFSILLHTTLHSEQKMETITQYQDCNQVKVVFDLVY